LKKLVFADLQCKASHERDIQCVDVEKVIEIRECDDKYDVTHQKVVIHELNNYFLTHPVILDVVVIKLNTTFSCYMEPDGS
jgi:hypothetical protein